MRPRSGRGLRTPQGAGGLDPTPAKLPPVLAPTSHSCLLLRPSQTTLQLPCGHCLASHEGAQGPSRPSAPTPGLAQPWAPRGHQMKLMNGLACAGAFFTPPDPARAPTKASLVQPRGRPCLVIKEFREAHNSRWGVVARVSHCQAGPVSRPGGVLTADSSPWTGSLRSPPALPTQRAPR